MGKVYSILLGFCALVLAGTASAQTCTNATSAGPCTGANVTKAFTSSAGGFTGGGFTWNSTNQNLNATVAKNNAYTLTSEVYTLSATGGNLGFNIAGTTSSLTSVGIQIVDATTSAVLFSCTQAPANFVSANQVCVQFSGITPGATVRYRFTFTTANGAPGDGVIVFDNFAAGAAAAAVPVKIDNLDAASAGSGIKLTWITSDEMGLASYDIERSPNGASFQLIGSVKAENKKSYSFTDNFPSSSNNFYRLKMVDLDGKVRISHIVSVKGKAIVGIETFPNPVNDRVIVQHPKAKGSTFIQIVNLQGQLVKTVDVPVNAVATQVEMTTLKSGAYYLIFRSATEKFSQRIVKQ